MEITHILPEIYWSQLDIETYFLTNLLVVTIDI